MDGREEIRDGQPWLTYENITDEEILKRAGEIRAAQDKALAEKWRRGQQERVRKARAKFRREVEAIIGYPSPHLAWPLLTDDQLDDIAYAADHYRVSW